VAAPVPAKPAVKRIEPTIITAPEAEAQAGPPAAILQETRSLSRADFDREINDFDRLMSTVEVQHAEDGGFVLTRLERKSWLASMGFREGDIVRTIAGEKVNTVEDAARLYARLRNTNTFAAEIQRGGTWVHLEIEIRDDK
jgi:type II secretory pathway component PulC